MADLAELGFVVRTGELKDASSELDRVTAAGARAERGAQGVGRASDRMGQQIERSLAPLRQMQSLLAAIGLGLGARELLRTADEFKLVEGRIRLVTESQEELIATQERLFAISQRTRSEFSQTANLFASVARVSTESNDRILQLAETIQMAGVVSGGDQASLAAGIMQLTQALGSGVLRGEEFNSVMENTPRIAQALAAALGRTTGELRAMAAEGRLTSDVVFEALLSQSEAIRNEFERMPLTVGQAMQVLGNEFGRYISQVDQSLGATERLAQGIVLLSQNLDSVMRVAGGVAVVIGARLVVALASAARSASLLSTALAFFGGPIGLAVSAVAVGIYLLATRTTEAEKAQQEYNAALDAADRYMTAARSGSTELAAKYREEADAALDAARQTLELERARVQAAIAAASVASNDPLDRFAAGMAGMTDSQAERKRQEALAGWEAQLARIDERLAAIAEKEAKVGQTAVAEGAGGAGGAADAGTVEQFEKLEASLERQLALYGQTTELAKLRYEMEHGSLQGLNDAQRKRLEDLAKELDAKAALTEKERQAALIKESVLTVEQKLNNQLALLDDLLDAGLLTWDEYSRAAAGAANALDKIPDRADPISDRLKQIEMAVHGFGRTFENALIDAAKGGQDAFRNMTEAILEDIARLVIRMQVIQPLASSINAGISGFFGAPTANADGNAFQGGRVIPFAKGGVVDGPTLFPMFGGKVGLMGEAGPEAIMPLKRGPDGKLGVVAQGGGGINVTVNQTIDARGQGDQAADNIRNSSREMADLIINTVVSDIRRRGAIPSALGAK